MGPALVAFIDLLGMSKAILSNWGAQTDQTLWRLIRIKAGVPREDAASQITVSAYDPSMDRDMERYLSVTRTISDSIVTMHALPNEIPPNLTHRIGSFVLNIGLICKQALKEGFTVRGAIEFGDMFWNETEFVGPALVHAYQLESKCARTSRILVGPKLMSRILSIAGSDEALNSLVHFLTVSDDGLIIVDPHLTIDQAQVSLLRDLQEQASQAANKYDEVIRILKMPQEKVRRPSRQEFNEAMMRLTAKG
jgi:hypothetical protein